MNAMRITHNDCDLLDSASPKVRTQEDELISYIQCYER